MIALLCIVVTGGAMATADAPSRSSTVRIALTSRADVERIARLGIALEGARLRDSSALEITLDEVELRDVRAAGFGVDIVVPDWHAAYAARLLADRPAALPASRVHNFHLGSMGGYLTLAELEAEVDTMHARYPHLIGKRDSIGCSLEGRTLWGVRISGAPVAGNDIPCALFTALHHAREPQGMMVLVYFIWYLLEHYGVNEDITALLNSREVYVVPVVNPDGYAMNAAAFPSGGGLWRKNRRANADGSFGVDLNRNYGFQWGYDDIGSSPVPSDNSYRGAVPFSEPETQAIRDLCAVKKPGCTLNYHGFGNVLIHPWGFSDDATPDSVLYSRIAEFLTAVNYYPHGTGGDMIGYSTNGDSDDWMYGETSMKPRIIAMTPEVGGADDGFWPVPSRIVPLADANLDANIFLTRCAGQHYAMASGGPDPVVDGDTAGVNLLLVNTGAGARSTTATLHFTSDDPGVILPAPRKVALEESTYVPLVVQRSTRSAGGARTTLRVLGEFPGGYFQDSVSFRLGNPALLFSDHADSTSPLWESQSTGSLTTWGFTTRTAYSGPGAYGDSPWGDYPNNYSSTYSLQQLLPLFGTAAELRFMARWDIEPEYDFCLVEASRDSGRTWVSLPGSHTRQGSGASGGKQAPDAHGYDRTRSTWVSENMDLAPVLGTRAMLRFRLESDSYLQRDGFSLDDLRVVLYGPALLGVADAGRPARMSLEQNYPNPFNPGTTIGYTVPGTDDRHQAIGNRHEAIGTRWVRLCVYDLLGREVAVLVDEQKEPGNYTVTWDAGAMASGVYIYRLSSGAGIVTRKMTLVK